MAQALPILVFSDLDGTLLDHDTYDWSPAHPALTALREIGAGVVLASSKTASEIRVLQADMGLSDWPAIVENGAGLLGGATGTDYATIRHALDRVPHREQFTGFGDMTVAGVVDTTGLAPETAALAKDRQFSEPGLWSGTAAQKTAFLDALTAQGIFAREGGRFLTLSKGRTKADQMAAIIEDLQPEHTLALGDAPNDVEMLETADHGVIIANPHRPPLSALKGEQSGQITRTTDPGPIGWNTAVLARLAHLKLKQTDSAHG